MRTRRFGSTLGLGLIFALVAAVACGSSADSTFNGNGNKNDGGSSGTSSSGLIGPGSSSGNNEGGTSTNVTALTIAPTTATLDLVAAPFPTQKLVATATYLDGTTGPAAATWTASNTAVGTIDGNGLYTPRGDQGGAITVTASFGGLTATATVTVKLHQVANTANLDAATQASLLGATTADGSITWTYPYDGTAFPRGLNAPQMMWNGGADADVYAIHVQSPTYDLQVFTTVAGVTSMAGTTPAGARMFAYDAANWTSFVESTSGNATLTVTRKSGNNYTKLIDQTWSIASRSMSGTIYYWAINKGQVVRIKPGAAQPDAFLGPLPTNPPPSGTPSLQCPSCHTASADGSRMLLSTGPWVGCAQNTIDTWSTVLDLAAIQPVFNGYETHVPPSDLSLAGLSADGKVAVQNWAKVRACDGSGPTSDSPLDVSQAGTSTTTLPTITGSGLEDLVGSGTHTYFPSFSADNTMFVYVDSTTNELDALDWDPVQRKFSNKRTLAPAGTTLISYPTVSPDHRWVVYQRGPNWGSLDTSYSGDLYAVDTTNLGHEISLDKINSSKSAAATDDRDLHRSYEPTFAPVASGGFFWIVFHTRRTYGNELVDVPYVNGTEGSGTKQLWVAAIDVPAAAASTNDPSHPPFWLPGQDPNTRNQRGYWALDPCTGDGSSCSSGSDCCTGFCDAVDDAGLPVCGQPSAGCSQPGDKCTTSSDCCNADQGYTCINHACSEPGPR